MSRDAFERFRARVLTEPDLQAILREIRSHGEFADLTVALAAKAGYDISADEVAEAIRAEQRAWFERWI